MKNHLYDNLAKTMKTVSGRWLQVSPNIGEGYQIFDPVAEIQIGRMLFDKDDNWVYDGDNLSVADRKKWQRQ